MGEKGKQTTKDSGQLNAGRPIRKAGDEVWGQKTRKRGN